jgi:hypothetical protein
VLLDGTTLRCAALAELRQLAAPASLGTAVPLGPKGAGNT